MHLSGVQIPPRHRIKNNLPGTVNFCPLIHKTAKLDKLIEDNLTETTKIVIKEVHKDILLRTSAFLLLKDSKASFTIEGETPSHSRAARWGQAIGRAGSEPLSKEELYVFNILLLVIAVLLKWVIEQKVASLVNTTVEPAQPIPEHISAKWQDLDTLINGLLDTESS